MQSETTQPTENKPQIMTPEEFVAGVMDMLGTDAFFGNAIVKGDVDLHFDTHESSILGGFVIEGTLTVSGEVGFLELGGKVRHLRLLHLTAEAIAIDGFEVEKNFTLAYVTTKMETEDDPYLHLRDVKVGGNVFVLGLRVGGTLDVRGLKAKNFASASSVFLPGGVRKDFGPDEVLGTIECGDNLALAFQMFLRFGKGVVVDSPVLERLVARLTSD